MNYAPLLGQRLYFDANIFIYGVEGGFENETQLKALWHYADTAGVEIIGSQILVTELLTLPLKLKNQQIFDSYKLLLTHNPSLSLVDLNYEIAQQAASLRAL